MYSKESNETFQFLFNFTLLNAHYVVPSISGVGFLLNFVCLNVFMSSRFKYDRSKFKYVLTKLFLEMIVCLIGISFYNFKLLRLICKYESFYMISDYIGKNTYLYQILRYVFNYFLNYILNIWIAVNEVFLTWNRYSILRKKDLFEKNFVYILITCGFSITCVCAPLLLALQITPDSKDTNMFYLGRTPIGNSFYFSITVLIVNLTVNLVCVVSLLVLSFLIRIEFKNFLYLKNCQKIQNRIIYKKLVYQVISKKKTEMKTIKMIWVINAIFLLGRIFNSAESLVYRLIVFKVIQTKIFYIYLCNFNVIISYLILCSNILVLINFNNKFCQTLKKIFTP